MSSKRSIYKAAQAFLLAFILKIQSQFMTSYHEATSAEHTQTDARCRRAACRRPLMGKHFPARPAQPRNMPALVSPLCRILATTLFGCGDLAAQRGGLGSVVVATQAGPKQGRTHCPRGQLLWLIWRMRVCGTRQALDFPFPPVFKAVIPKEDSRSVESWL